jgi:hypothetical protein
VLRAAGDKAIAQMKEPFEGDGYALLAMVYKDKDQPLSVRLSAAGMAMPYERPRLSQVDMTHRYGVDRDAGLGWARHGWAWRRGLTAAKARSRSKRSSFFFSCLFSLRDSLGNGLRGFGAAECAIWRRRLAAIIAFIGLFW